VKTSDPFDVSHLGLCSRVVHPKLTTNPKQL
jgi:hypothetical protein